MHSKIKLYDRSNIDELSFPQTPDGQYAKDFLIPLMKEGTKKYIRNIDTKLYVLKMDDVVLPVSVNDKEYDNSYVCSPYTHYIQYAKEELYLIKNKFFRLLLTFLLNCLSPIFKASQVNKTVHVNNWFVSTNLYPKLSNEQINEMTLFLKEKFPKHVLVFRSINKKHHSKIYEKLIQMGYKLIASRQVYIIHPKEKRLKRKQRKSIRQDIRLIEKNGYQLVTENQISKDDIRSILALYRQLYLKKYSMHNPQFTEKMIELALEKDLLHFNAVKKDGRMDAVLGYFCRNGVMTTPLLGYDLSLPLETGLYRMMVSRLYYIALENHHSLHRSSGAAQFKRYRGADPEIEYSAIYDCHLPWYRRIIWSFLKLIINHIGIPIVKKYKL